MKKLLALALAWSLLLAPNLALAQASTASPLATNFGGQPIVSGASAAGGGPGGASYFAICGIDTSTLCRGILTDSIGVTEVGVRPPGTAESCSSGNVANAAVACTLAAAAAKTTYITGFVMNSNGATAALGVTCTITGAITGTLSFTYVYGAIASVTNQPLVVMFPTPVPASAANTTLVLSCPASGAGGTIASISAFGFQL